MEHFGAVVKLDLTGRNGTHLQEEENCLLLLPHAGYACYCNMRKNPVKSQGMSEFHNAWRVVTLPTLFFVDIGVHSE